FLFFQAEDGIRDFHVTGVQTCALPIFKVEALRRAESSLSSGAVLASNTSSISIDDLSATLQRPRRFLGLHFFNPVPASALVEVEIGRASCRERGDVGVLAVGGCSTSRE